MAVLYVAAGINHFVHPDTYQKIMPPWLPAHSILIFLSGILEVMFGSLLIFKKTRRAAAWLIIFMLFFIFPANVQMALNYREANHPLLWLAIFRLPLQVLLIWWAFQYTRPVHKQKNQL